MKEILITGGCGYLGAKLSKHFAENGYGVSVFDSIDPSKYYQWTSLMKEIIVGDIRDEVTISKLAEKEYSAVIHLISLDHHKSEENPNIVSSINVMPTWNLLDKFTKNGLKKFIYFSTVQVYGKIADEIVTEERIPLPQNAYGLTHYFSENICNYYNRKTNTTCINVRLSNSYGSPVFNENNCWELVINDLCKTAFEQNKIKLSSDGSPQRDFIHISDICKAVEILITSEDISRLRDNVFHIASGNTLTILELAHEVKKVFDNRYSKDIPIILPNNAISEEPGKCKNIDKFVLSKRNMEHLGFQPTTDLIKGIDKVFAYLENHAKNN
jgi:nucleoside-diphosphate-sugar epimerase